jgi:hypothetical protein
MGNGLTIRTSEKGWLEGLAQAYCTKTQVLLIDDADVGIDPVAETLFAMGRKSELTRSGWYTHVGQ